MLNRVRYGTAVLALLSATSFALAANRRPQSAPQSQPPQLGAF